MKKINISSDLDLSKLFQHTNKSQIEEKFGGTAPNVTSFWPPKCPSQQFFLPEESLEQLLDPSYFQLQIRRGEEAERDEFGVEFVTQQKISSPWSLMEKCNLFFVYSDTWQIRLKL